jgi:uronate dehydrogenase
MPPASSGRAATSRPRSGRGAHHQLSPSSNPAATVRSVPPKGTTEGPIAITGAAGRIGTVLRRGLGPDLRIRLIDVRPVDDVRDGEEVVTADLRSFDETRAALDGAAIVLHLAAIPTEAPFAEILSTNIQPTYNVFEASRRVGVRRIVFASTIHVSGFVPWGDRLSPTDPVRPDTFYAVSKVFGEALGRLYADKYGLEVVCLRICWFGDEPRAPGGLWTWLSHRDAVSLFRAAITAPDIHFVTVYGVSRNTRRPMTEEGWDVIGYEPKDDAEAFAGRFPDAKQPHRWLGIEFTERDPGPN